MSDPKMVTEREAVERERKAFMTGWTAHLNHGTGRGLLSPLPEIEARYPLPKVRRLREVKHYPGHSGLFGGALGVLYRYNPTTKAFEWRYDTHYAPWAMTDRVPTNMLEALADLKANPWEEVDG